MITRSCLVAMGCILALASVDLAAQTGDSASRSEIRTSGTATRSVAPDLATITFEFSVVGKTPREAGVNLAHRADSLRRALAKLGIPRDSLVTGSRYWYWRPRIEVVLGPARHYPPPAGVRGDSRIEHDTTYRSWEVITARVRDLEKVGEAIDTALALRIFQISNVTFTRTDQDSIRDIALQAATARARRQAEVIAEASGGRLGRVIWIGTEGTERGYYAGLYLDGVGPGNASSSGQTVLVQPQIPVTVTVYGRWELVR